MSGTGKHMATLNDQSHLPSACEPSWSATIPKFGSVAQFVGQNGTSRSQAAESVTRGDRRRREIKLESPSPPLGCLAPACEYHMFGGRFDVQISAIAAFARVRWHRVTHKFCYGSEKALPRDAHKDG